jgi:hypothetical protein
MPRFIIIRSEGIRDKEKILQAECWEAGTQHIKRLKD